MSTSARSGVFWWAVACACVAIGCASASDAPPDASGTHHPDAADLDAPGPRDAPDAAVPVVQLVEVVGPANIPQGTTAQYAAFAHYSDGTMVDVTATATWSTMDPSVATVDHDGLATGVGVGTTFVQAMLGSHGGLSQIFVGAGALTSIAITAPTTPVAKGLTVQLAATGSYSDGMMHDVSTQATWTSSAPAVATVGADGLVTAVAVGTATITAAVGTVSQDAAITVGPPAPDHLALAPPALTLAEQQRARVHAQLVYSDGSQSDVTAMVTWTSSAASATVSGGVVDATLTSGPSTITAAMGAMSGTLVATVTTATCHPVINEVQAAGATSADEWAELYNPCTVAQSVASWTLVYRAAGTTGATDTNTLATLTGTMAVGEYRLYAGQAYGGTNDGLWGGGTSGLLAGTSGALALRSGPASTGPLVDAVAYGTITAGNPFLESAAAPALATSKSIARGPFDGNDTNANNNDFTLQTAPTPRAANYP